MATVFLQDPFGIKPTKKSTLKVALVLPIREGNFQITGRLKDLINRGGIKINPIDVEVLIDKHPKVLQSAIVPMPDEIMGEKACVFILPRDGESVTLREICDWLQNNGVAKMKWPERLELISEMPLTPTRKTIKGALRPRQSL